MDEAALVERDRERERERTWRGEPNASQRGEREKEREVSVEVCQIVIARPAGRHRTGNAGHSSASGRAGGWRTGKTTARILSVDALY